MEPDVAPFFVVVPQRHKFDCAVCCLAMLLGQDYERTLLAFDSLAPLVRGVSCKNIQRAARRLGVELRLYRKVDLENDTGLLMLDAASWLVNHTVVLKEGMVVDPSDTTVWEVDDYIAANKASVENILKVRVPARKT